MANETTRVERSAPGWLKAAMLLAIIGALNWGLIGFFNWNLVDAIFGGDPRETTSTASRIIYAVVGLAGLLGLLRLPRLTGRAHDREEAYSR